MSKYANKPIFIIASERSGSNLLRKILSDHPSIAAPRSPHLLNVFYKIIPFYIQDGKLNKIKLATDILTVVNHPYHDWKIDPKQFLDRVDSCLDFFEMFAMIYSIKSSASNAIRFASKEINTQKYIFQLLHKFPDAQFINLYRDPRDVVSSWKNASLMNMNAAIQASKWNSEQIEVWLACKAQSINIFHVSYEELVKNPSNKIQEIFKFLNEPIHEINLSNNQNREDVEWNQFWQNLNKPISTASIGKFKENLNQKEISQVENICREQMQELNYPFLNLESKQESPSILSKIVRRLNKSEQGNEFWPPVKNELLDNKIRMIRNLKEDVRTNYAKRK